MSAAPVPIRRTGHWQKSSFSGVDGEDCIEVTDADPRLLLRESEAPTTMLTVSPLSLLALIRQVRTASSASTSSRASCP
ncbi:DUF397 domain-containing protein [Streptomyces sp. NPDC020951]|uniref:DUF397 domain-containing protein n=1 Tax=Streptomyces sp. NPDC020951 TaxID=3365104 RepID=UPI00379A2A32